MPIFLSGAIVLGWLFFGSPVFSSDNSTSHNNILITVIDTNFVSGEIIFLKDISTITANGFLKESIGSIEIGSSPKPGKIAFFDKKKIISIIKNQQYLPVDTIINSPDRIYVKRKVQTISTQSVKAVVDKYLLTQLKDQEFVIKSFNVRGLESYSYGKLDLQIVSDTLIGKKGKLYGYIDIIVDGDKKDRLSISGTIAIFKNILHTKKTLKRGVRPDRQNIAIEKKNIFDLNSNYLTSFDQVEGKVLKSDVRRGKVLTENMLVDPPLVKKGDIISLIARNDNMVIITTGISKEDGFENQVIKVENINSGKLIHGVVKEKSKVEVVY